ncbi:MAG: DJ-1/PfpI family protein [Nitrospinae bacterium]|nr:DJ-1/PfpI family protein [Nitrospinota bacterium]
MEKKRVLMVISQENFRDEELLHPSEVFRQKGFEVVVAAGEKKEALGSYGAKVTPDMTIDEAGKQSFDAVVIVGGNGSRIHLWGNQTLFNLVRAHHATGRPLGAICIAPVVLAQAGLLKGVDATMYKSADTSEEFAKHGVKTSEKDVVVSGSIVTGNGPAAARKFGAAVASLVEPEK